MNMLLGAQACGFGPVSKLAAVSRLLGGVRRHFVGDGIALDFARRNPGAFDTLEACDPDDLRGLLPRLGGFDAAVVVMHADLAFWASRAGVPVYFFDSLFAFWMLDRPAAELVACAREIRRLSDDEAWRRFQALSPHERIYVAHVLATRAFAQNFPGVRERVSELRRLGVDHVEVCGPIIDYDTVQVASPAPPPLPSQGPWRMVVSLGGFKNFLLDFGKYGAFLRLIERWAEDFVRAHPRCEGALVCSGAYSEPRMVRVDGRPLEFRFLPHDEFIQAVLEAPVYLCTPGLTAIHEAAQLGRLPFLLPEEHYGHIFNYQALRGTTLGGLGMGFGDVLDDYRVPPDDFAGTAAIVAHTRALYDSPDAYARFRDTLGRRLDAFLELTEHERARGVAELRSMMAGRPLREVVDELFPALAGAAA